MKQLRIDFPDYPAKEQEKDVERFKLLEKKYQPHIFLLKFDGLWASMTFTGGKIRHKFYEGMNLYQTFNAVKKTHPFHKMKYIMNEGLENYLRDMRKKELSRKSLQLNIDFTKQR
ncbi:MAG: hypothetical protein IJ077_08575 [Eubacterium sp.]|nr:hypothetical protein [Alphaproteobacteria bacterium]MBQ8981647.1 hypothetical protein [Eubacterium sp.]